MDKWEFYKDKAGEWRWRRTAPNGEIVGASSEGYHNRSDCVDNAEPEDGQYENALQSQCNNARKNGRAAQKDECYVELNKSGKQHVELGAHSHQQGRVVLQ